MNNRERLPIYRDCAIRSGQVIRFPARRGSCIWVKREKDAWLVIARDHGWLHGDIHDAHANAQWLAQNLGLPVRCAS
jgi:hypothetical protein